MVFQIPQLRILWGKALKSVVSNVVLYQRD